MNEERVFAKIAWRLMPFIMLLYVVNYIDRVNVGFAALTMNSDLGLSPTVFGIGGTTFFIGYLLFQVPANLMLEKLGARIWIFIILAVWGLVSAANAFISGPYSYYALRLLLGVAESGFFPGMLLYMTFWFPPYYRSRFIGWFMASIPLANIIGGPLSTSILEMDGIWGLKGWQWMFILEGIPATLFAFLTLFLLPDRPATASFLSAEEKKFIASRLKAEDRSEHHDLWPALKDPRVYMIGLVLTGNQVALYGIQLWMPQMVQAMGYSNFWNGFIVAGPFLVSMVAMIWWARRSDMKRERIWHVAIPMVIGAAGLLAASILQNNVLVLIALTFALVGTLSYNGPFFSLPSTFLAGTAAAGGIGFVNTLGSIGRSAGPPLVGVLKEQSGNYSSGMVAMALALLMGAGVALLLGRMMAARNGAVLAAKPSRG